jgi:ATP synthase protein I
MAPAREPSTWRALAELSSIGMMMVLATVIGLVAGYYADRWLGTEPWLLLVGLIFGIAAGFVSLFRSVKAAESTNDSVHDHDSD